jgi:hypothetical protein
MSSPLDTLASPGLLGLRPEQRGPFGRLIVQALLLGLVLISYYSVANAQFLAVWGATSVPWTYIVAAATTSTAALLFSWAERRFGLRSVAVATLGPWVG